ncbi:MAG: PilW family protein [Sideroxydans sp.]|nr:PilW family protein [Sideroxydans sp.]
MPSISRPPFHQSSHPSPNGFSLVELMVGLTIGLLATMVIMQAFSAFEARKRATTGTDDAQTNGNIALYTIGNDLQQAGFPLFPIGIAGVPDSAIECATLSINGAASTIDNLAPVLITDESSNGGDSITIRYGNSASGGVPSKIFKPGAGANEIILDSNFGCVTGDTTLVVNGATCNMSAASAVTGTTSITLADSTGAITNAFLSCLGTWNSITYTANGDLIRTTATGATPTVAGVVNIQAQYGVSDTQTSNAVTQWVNATGIWAAPMTVATRNRIKAIRIAVVTRNAKREATKITDPCSSNTAASPTGLCAWDATSAKPPIASPAPSIDLSAFDTDWQHYRYRVFETIIPLRSVLWSQGTL